MTFPLRASDTGAPLSPSRVTATATVTLAGKPVRSRVSLALGKAKVVVVAPGGARSKAIVIRLSVTLGGRTTTRQISVPIA